MSATNNRKTIPDILAALKTAIEGVQYQDAPAFERVELFDNNSITDAISRLLGYDKTLCFIIPLDEQFTKITSGRKLLFGRSLPIALLISDRAIDSRQKALFGSEDTPGAHRLMEAVLPAIIGQLIENPNGVVCKPTNCGVVDVINTDKNLPGRAVIELDVECTGGTIETTLSLSPTV